MSRVCVYGVGAIGGLLAARLALAGETVTGIARGEQLAAIRRNGLTLIEAGQSRSVELSCVDDPAGLGIQDVIWLTVKSHQLPAVAGQIAPLLGENTCVVTVCNGFPWWYGYGAAGARLSSNLDSVDPSGSLWQILGPQRAIGCVVYPAARQPEAGIVEHVFGNRLTLGEPDGSRSPRVQALSRMLTGAGFEAPLADAIRGEMWTKLLANVAYNPVNTLTGGTLGDMLDTPDIRRLLEAIMTEAAAVATAMGSELPVSARELMQLTRPLGGHKTSMLQDLEAGRTVELKTIVGPVQELGQRFRVETPVLDTIAALAKQRARVSGCYH
jgi:2-dehydropantoate 2-reductase